MRVIRLCAENFKRLTAIDITPAGDVVTITGKNAQGKSSILDAIWSALEGAAVMPGEAVRKGADRARIRVDLGKYIVTRVISRKDGGGQTTQVKVEGADGAVFPSPQKLLDDLIGELSFDPLHFARMSETPAGRRQQFDMLSKFVPGVDFENIANRNRGDTEKRTEVNRRAKEARAAASVIVVPDVIPELVDTAPLLAQLGGATQREAEIAAHERRRDEINGRLAAEDRATSKAEDEVATLRARLEVLKLEAVERNSRIEVLRADIEAFPPPPERIDTAAVAADLNAAQEKNRQVDDILARATKRASMVRLAESLEKESDDLTAAITARLEKKAAAVSAAVMPVEGLGFGEGEILLNGVPFAQGSSAEQLRTSVAIAAAMNPSLRVIHIRDGSLLDVDSMAWLAEYAKAHDLQCWVELVGTDSKVGILIEDGHVKAAEAAEVAA